jgi:Zn-dependent peptidase ImmA (M78 family)
MQVQPIQYEKLWLMTQFVDSESTGNKCMATVAPKFITPKEMDEIASGNLKRLDLYAVPVNPATVAAKEGIGVFGTTFADPLVSGVIRKETDGKYQIYVNVTHSPLRARYTIAHELGHYFLHKDFREFVDPELNLYRCQIGEQESNERAMEIQANMFAASLLMPVELLSTRFASVRDVGQLAREFRVSRSAMGIRIASLGLE